MRATKVCSSPGCPNVQPCPEHDRKPWASSTRRQRSTLSGSAQQKRARFVLLRDDTVCHVCHMPGADQADHVLALALGGADTVQNMAAIHSEPCHRLKTEQEAKQALAATRTRTTGEECQ